MRIVIVVPRQDRITGNWVSAERFRAGLERLGHQVTIRDTSLEAETEFRASLQRERPDVALLLHAYRSGRPWLETAAGLNIPYVVMLTGTDINHGLDDPQQAPLILTVLDQAAAVVHQNPLLVAEFESQHPSAASHLRYVAAGTVLGQEPYPLRLKHELATDRILFLCPAGLRPVKGLIELLELFDHADAAALRLLVAFCGPILDATYARHFLDALTDRDWARYLGVVPNAAMASAMSDADVILNNSQAEGLSNALLEASALGIPILARDIPGNAAIVTHGVNGLLYNDTSFAACVRELAGSRQLREKLSKPDVFRYNPVREASQLAEILGWASRTIRVD